jgi:hypothetical protein
MSGSVSGSEYQSDSELVLNGGSGSRLVEDSQSESELVLKSLLFILFGDGACLSNLATVEYGSGD